MYIISQLRRTLQLWVAFIPDLHSTSGSGDNWAARTKRILGLPTSMELCVRRVDHQPDQRLYGAGYTGCVILVL